VNKPSLGSVPDPVNPSDSGEPPAGPPAPGDGYVQSFARGLAVLRSFGARSSAQTLSEAAERTGLTRAGARRILLTLQHLGYVESEGRLFRLTPKVLELGFAYLSSQPVWQLAQPVMEGLTQELKESCSAAVLDGDDIVYVLRVPAHQIMSINLGVGSRLPAHCTSMGRVLLADLIDRIGETALRQRLARMPLERRTCATITEVDALFTQLQQVKQQGYALVAGELEEGLISIAAPIVNRVGRTVAAVNISGQLHRTPPAQMIERFLPPLQAAAGKINALVRAHT